MANTYRKTQGEGTWHFCRNCPHWPITNYVEQPTAPSTGEMCSECETKRREGNCR